ncbi:pilus assembly protein PilZ [Ralstonia sp. 25C]|uniref:pilus assembly protein PilZ n=1 Tax=Ralstonia sp. 25C TaxID=3447363 RepID=UPI003F74B28B
MLNSNPLTHARGFSIVAVISALIIISLLMVAALHIARDQRRRATLYADHALAMREAEAALAAAECELALATKTPTSQACGAPPPAARIAALDPITLAGFAPGRCGTDATTRGLCWPNSGQTVQDLAHFEPDQNNNSKAKAVELDTFTTADTRDKPAHRARYVIEPIPDTQPGLWTHAGTERTPPLFRITAIGFGNDEDVNVMLQSVYRVRAVAP